VTARCRFIVTGQVQGVGYRWFVARHASALGLGGYARNLGDGSVEIGVVGEPEQLALLEVQLRRGPEFAKVARVDKADISDEVPLAKVFEIR
jgi:acylphosphatase